MHIDNKGNILILGEGLIQGLDDTTFTTEVQYPINFTQSGKRFALSLATVSYLLMLKEHINSKQNTLK